MGPTFGKLEQRKQSIKLILISLTTSLYPNRKSRTLKIMPTRLSVSALKSLKDSWTKAKLK